MQPEEMTHDMLCAVRDEEWATKEDDSSLMSTLCAEMRNTPPEEYRAYLITRREARKEMGLDG